MQCIQITGSPSVWWTNSIQLLVDNEFTPFVTEYAQTFVHFVCSVQCVCAHSIFISLSVFTLVFGFWHFQDCPIYCRQPLHQFESRSFFLLYLRHLHSTITNGINAFGTNVRKMNTLIELWQRQRQRVTEREKERDIVIISVEMEHSLHTQ